jgi:hypothetical protein
MHLKRIIDNQPKSGELVINISKFLITCGVYEEDGQLSLLYEYSSKDSNADLLHQMKQDLHEIHIVKTIIGICDHRFTLLPRNYKELSSSAINSLFVQAQNEVIQEMKLKNESMGVYLAKNNTLGILHQLYEKPIILNTYLSLLHGYNSKGDVLHAYFNEQHLILTAYKDGKLQLHQGYEVDHMDDVLYHIYKSSEVLAIDHIVANDHEELYQKGKSFIKKIGTYEKSNIEMLSLYQYAHHQW